MAIGSSFEEARGSVQEANSAYGPTESEIRNLQNEIQRLSGEIAQKETQVHEKEQELENNEVQIEHLQSEINRLETEIEELEEEQSSSDDEDDDSGGVDNSAEIASLQSQIDQLSTEVNHLQTQSQQMRQVISQMQAEIQRLQQEKLQKEQDLQLGCSKCMAVANFLSGLNGVLLADAAKNQSQAAAFSNIASSKYGRSAAGAASQVGNYAHQRTQLAQEASRLSAAYATLAGSGAYVTASAVNSDIQGGTSQRYFNSEQKRMQPVPSPTSGRWSGVPGNSKCAPQSQRCKEILQRKGIDGINYINGFPDFSPVSESTVKIGMMNSERSSRNVRGGKRDGADSLYSHSDGTSSHNADKNSMQDLAMKYENPGNYQQADILTAQSWTKQNKEDHEWTAVDVANYRKANDLTWHECLDGETMMLVPNAINKDFGHLGGTAEAAERERIRQEVEIEYASGNQGDEWVQLADEFPNPMHQK